MESAEYKYTRQIVSITITKVDIIIILYVPTSEIFFLHIVRWKICTSLREVSWSTLYNIIANWYKILRKWKYDITYNCTYIKMYTKV